MAATNRTTPRKTTSATRPTRTPRELAPTPRDDDFEDEHGAAVQAPRHHH